MVGPRKPLGNNVHSAHAGAGCAQALKLALSMTLRERFYKGTKNGGQ
jgi:hypothetical protein